MTDLKVISMEELLKEVAVQRKPASARCPMKDCSSIGYYDRCYLDNCCLCPIYAAKYETLTQEQRMVL